MPSKVRSFAKIMKNVRCFHFKKESGYSQLRAPLIVPTEQLPES